MFYDNFERLCKEQGTNPSKACFSIGLSRGTGSAWKQRGSIPDYETLKKLAEFLHCEVLDFFEGCELPNELQFLIQHTVEIKTKDQQPEIVDEFLTIYNSLSNRQKHEFMSKVYNLADEVKASHE